MQAKKKTYQLVPAAVAVSPSELEGQLRHAGVPLESWSQPAREAFVQQTSVRELAPGDCLYENGQVKPPLALVLEGLLVTSVGHDEGEPCAVEFLRSGRLLLAGATSQDLSYGTVTAVAASRVAVCDLDLVIQLMAQDLSFSQWLLQCLVMLTAGLSRARAASRAQRLNGQMAHLYWSLSQDTEVGRSLPRIPQHLLASYFGVNREEVNRKHQMLRKAGFLRVEGERIILDPAIAGLISSSAVF